MIGFRSGLEDYRSDYASNGLLFWVRSQLDFSYEALGCALQYFSVKLIGIVKWKPLLLKFFKLLYIADLVLSNARLRKGIINKMLL